MRKSTVGWSAREGARAVAPHKRRSQAARSAETRGKLLSAAIDCLCERGYAGTTTIEVAAKAGVSRGVQLHHFPTKAEDHPAVASGPPKLTSGLRQGLLKPGTIESGARDPSTRIDARHPEIAGPGVQYEGQRFRAECRIAVVFGDPMLGEPERVRGDDLLAFAGIDPPELRLYPVEPTSPRSCTRIRCRGLRHRRG